MNLNLSIFLVKSARFSCSLLSICEVHSISCAMEGVFCIPFFVGTEADNNSPFWSCPGDRVEVVKVHYGTVLGDAFSTWRQIRPPKHSHNALWQPSRPSPPCNLKVANRRRYKEKNSHGYDRRDWVQVGNQYSNLRNTCCKHQGSRGFPWLGAITEYVQKRNQIVSSYGLQQTRCPVKLVTK